MEERGGIRLTKVKDVNGVKDLVIDDMVKARTKSMLKKLDKWEKCSKCKSTRHNIHNCLKSTR